ncbi:hypothetical protein VNI00_011111 [Paramarasmius palmivorus]|uniref:Chromatin elongation factor spt5 n=1 Tax=Paramarasmius palmivorus TaxID=297713 RepID=A0AAW0CFS4_9AGAR
MPRTRRGLWTVFVDDEADGSDSSEDEDQLESDGDAGSNTVSIPPPVARLTAEQAPVVFDSLISRILAREEARDQAKRTVQDTTGSISSRTSKTPRLEEPQESAHVMPAINTEIKPTATSISNETQDTTRPDEPPVPTTTPRLPQLMQIQGRLARDPSYTLADARTALDMLLVVGSEAHVAWAGYFDELSEAVSQDEPHPTIPNVIVDSVLSEPSRESATADHTEPVCHFTGIATKADVSSKNPAPFTPLASDTRIYSIDGTFIGYARHAMLSHDSKNVPTVFNPITSTSSVSNSNIPPDLHSTQTSSHPPSSGEPSAISIPAPSEPLSLPELSQHQVPLGETALTIQPSAGDPSTSVHASALPVSLIDCARAIRPGPDVTDARLDPVIADTIEDLADQLDPVPALCGTYISRVQCKRGFEGQSVFQITTAVLEQDCRAHAAYNKALEDAAEQKQAGKTPVIPTPVPPMPVVSAFSAGQPGWIYIELRATHSVDSPEVLHVLRSATKLVVRKTNQIPVPQHEVLGFQHWRKSLLPESRSYCVQLGDWVEITSGLYKGDVGLVVGEEPQNLSGSRRVALCVVPRLDLVNHKTKWRSTAIFKKTFHNLVIPGEPLKFTTTTSSCDSDNEEANALLATSALPTPTPATTSKKGERKALFRPPAHPVWFSELRAFNLLPDIDYRGGCDCGSTEPHPEGYMCPMSWIQIDDTVLKYGLGCKTFNVLHLRPATTMPDPLVGFLFRSHHPLVRMALAYAPYPRSWRFEEGDVVMHSVTRSVQHHSQDRRFDIKEIMTMANAFRARHDPRVDRAIANAKLWASELAAKITDGIPTSGQTSHIAPPIPYTWDDPFFFHSVSYLVTRYKVTPLDPTDTILPQENRSYRITDTGNRAMDATATVPLPIPGAIDSSGKGRIVNAQIVNGRIGVLPDGESIRTNERKLSVLSLVKLWNIGDHVQIFNPNVLEGVVVPLDPAITDLPPTTALVVSTNGSLTHLQAISGGAVYVAHANSLAIARDASGDMDFMPLTQGVVGPTLHMHSADAPAPSEPLPGTRAPWKDLSVSIVRGDKKRQMGRVIDVFKDDKYASGIRVLVEIQTVGSVIREPYDYGSLRHAQSRKFLRLPEDPFWQFKEGYEPKYHSTEQRYFQSVHRRRQQRANVTTISDHMDVEPVTLPATTPMHLAIPGDEGTVWDPNFRFEPEIHPQFRWVQEPDHRARLKDKKFIADIQDGSVHIQDASVGFTDDLRFVHHYPSRVRTAGSATTVPVTSLRPPTTPIDLEGDRSLLYVVRGKHAGSFGRRASHCWVDDEKKTKNGRLVVHLVTPTTSAAPEQLIDDKTIIVRPAFLIRLKESRKDSTAAYALMRQVRIDFGQGKRLVTTPGVPYVDSDSEDSEDIPLSHGALPTVASTPAPLSSFETSTKTPWEPIGSSWGGATPVSPSFIEDFAPSLADPVDIAFSTAPDAPHRKRLLQLRDEFWLTEMGMDGAIDVVNKVTLPDTPARWEWTKYFGELNEAYLEGQPMPAPPDV